jgi:MFS family permease
MISFDQLLSDRIGFGMFQSKTFLIVSLIDLMDGAEIQYLALLNVILMKEWEFGISGLIIMAMGYNFGLFVGAALCAVYADRVGRRNILLFGTCL